VTDSIPCAQEEIDINMHVETRQRRAARKEKAAARDGAQPAKVEICNLIEETRHCPIVQLAGFGQRQVQFSWRLPCRLL